MSDEEIKTLKEYVGLGGILIVTPDSSSYTSFWTKRRDSPWNKDNPFIRIVEEKDLLSPEIVTVMTRSLLNRPPWIEIQGNGYQLANPTAQTGRLVIHVLNYDRDRSFRNLKVAISVRGYEARSANALDRNTAARWLTPDSPSEEQLPIVWSGDRAEIRIPLLKVSGLLVISPKDER